MSAIATAKLLHDEVTELAFQWQLYLAMFGKKDLVVQLNAISPVTFGLLQKTMIADLILRVCALTDPAKQGKFSNLVISRLAEEMEAESGASLEHDLKAAVDDASNACVSLREHRNKLHAHLDLETAKTDAADLPRLKYDDITRAVESIFRSVSLLRTKLTNSVDAYEHAVCGNVAGELEWLCSDWFRFKKLREWAEDPTISDPTLRELAKQRSDRRDAFILGVVQTPR